LRLFLLEYSDELRRTAPWMKDAKGQAEQLVHGWRQQYGHPDTGALQLYRSHGCEKCNQTGYKGRVGLHELLIANDGIKKLIQERARVAEIFAAAVETGMRTLKMDGMEKILMGLTDLKQVRSVCIK
jgi:type II secretory ATPase GspE/PulE/Tfp pilus assembly ATPase PilB-like protein